MSALDVVGWMAAVVILGSYAASIWLGSPRLFHWGNLFGSLSLMPVNVALGLWYSFTLGVCFSTLGVLALVRRPYEGADPEEEL